MAYEPNQNNDEIAATFSECWEFDLSQRGANAQEGGVLQLKAIPWYRRFYRRYIRRFTVRELYVWQRSTWASAVMMAFSDPMRHGNFKISQELERKVPQTYQMLNGWTIPEADLKYLCSGPLISESGERLLVPAHGPILRFLVALNPYSSLIKFVVAILALVIMVAKFWKYFFG